MSFGCLVSWVWYTAWKKKGGDIYEKLFETADLLLANSTATYDALLEFGAPREKIKLHNIGVDLSQFEYRPPTTEGPLNSVTLLSVGGLTEEKGHADAIKALNGIISSKTDTNIQYRIVGGGSLQHELEELAHGMGISKHVEFVGPVS